MDEDFAQQLPTASAAGDLGKQLKCAFASTVIRNVETKVGVEDANESDVREMQTFGDHLRADHDIVLPRLEIIERVLELILTAHDVSVDTCDFGVAKDFFEDAFNTFGAETY